MNVLSFEDPTLRTIGRALRLQAEAQPDAVFLMDGETRYTFAEVNTRVNDLAGGLAAQGLAEGERVAFYLGSAPEVIFLAIAAN